MTGPFATDHDNFSALDANVFFEDHSIPQWPKQSDDNNNLDEKDVDSILAQELNRMSLGQREAMYEEIHGVDNIIDETPEFLNEKMNEFDYALNCIRDKPAYDLAARICPHYVSDFKFRLMFLRATAFHPVKAAMRCVKYIEEKQRLFGNEALGRRLFLSDLDKNDMHCLKSGALQVLPQRDRAGRAVIGNFRNLIPRSYKVVDNMVRALFFFQSVIAEDEETQRRGVVTITYVVGNLVGDYNRELMKAVGRSSYWTPVRTKGTHICFNDPVLRTLQPLLLTIMGPEQRARLRLHYGTHTECQYSLMTFGIPVQHLPVTHEGDLKTSNHLKWVAKRQIMDNCLRRGIVFNAFDLPRRDDVLLGRGKPYQENPGNVFMRSLVESNLDIYQAAPLGQKNVLAAKIVDCIKPSKFVKKRDDGWWVEVDRSEAMMKVLKTFRTVRSLQSENSRQAKVSNSQKRARVIEYEPKEKNCFGLQDCGDNSNMGRSVSF